MLPRTLHSGATQSLLGAVVVVSALGASAYAFGMPFDSPREKAPADGPQAAQSRRTVPALTIRAASARHAVAPGRSIGVRVAVRRSGTLIRPPARGRKRLAAPIRFSVEQRLPVGIRAAVTPRTTRSIATRLTIQALERARPGTYRLRLRARGRLRPTPRYRMRYAETVITFVVTDVAPAPRTWSFGIDGAISGRLTPGRSVPVDLTLENPHGSALRITRLAVGIGAIRAPRASAERPCTAADFTVEQFAGAYDFVIPSSSRRSLGDLAIPPAQWPRIGMIDRAVNQDGCKDSSLTLDFSGSGTGVGR